MTESGIYIIQSVYDEKVYVGSTVDLEKRRSYHFTLLCRNKHPNPHLQRAWNKYREFTFKWIVLENCPKERLIEQEQYWIDYYTDYYEVGKLYNICPTAGSPLGTKHSIETRRKLSRAARGNKNWLGRKHTLGTREKISRARAAAWRRTQSVAV